MHMRSRTKRRCVLRHARTRLAGFTFIELMIAILVVAILAAIAMPYYADYRNRVEVAQATNDIIGNEALVEKFISTSGSLPNTWADMPGARTVDPWGFAYVYYNIQVNGKGHARKDHALNPLNTDYDMYSVGADGATKAQITQKDSVDDVIRASNGGYVGLAAGF